MVGPILLDSGPLGLLCNPNRHVQAIAIRAWLRAHAATGRRILIPEIADYEVRRELLRNRSLKALAALDQLALQLEYLPITTPVMRLAADFWAHARIAGFQTAHNLALDGDVILAAQAESLGTPSIIATGNPGHLTRFTAADLWQNIQP